MSKLKSYIPVFISLVLSAIIIVVFGVTTKNEVIHLTKEVYNVYLDGKYIGSINSQKELERYIDNEQKNLKSEYNVDKIYVPNGIDIEKSVTHNVKVTSVKKIYEKIKVKKGFNIKGYVVTIGTGKDKIKLNLLKKGLFNKAVNTVVRSFVNPTDIQNYRKNTQPEIKTTGSLIENIELDQNVEIKEAFISTEEQIYSDVDSLAKYLLFGTSDTNKEYTVQPGDTIETVSFNNKLSTEEFLIVNPEFTSSKNLLSPGQKVNIALINPVLKIRVEKHIVEDMDKPFETTTRDDPSLAKGTQRVEVEGVNGLQRVTEKIKYVNGEITQSVIVKTDVLKEPVTKVVLNGTKQSSYGGYNFYSSNEISSASVGGDWGWPTVSPYIITSEFKWRWGRLHAGIDISCAFGSPIFSVGNGTVVSTFTGCPGHGSLGSNCGGGYGNSVFVDYGGGVVIKYGHLNTVNVGNGQRVSRGQVIGTMGNSGRSSGTHLHYEIRLNGAAVNPRSLY